MAPPLLQLTDIALTFGGTPLLTGANLSVSTGERVSLIGRNGSGKSTLLKIAAGLVEPDRGERFMQPGASVRYLAQEPDLSGHATTLAYVEAWCRYRKDPRFDLAYALLALRRSKVPDLADAVRRDIANRLADDHDAAGALAWGHIDEFLDTLLAVYLDLGRFDDANVIAAEIRKGTGRSCGREVARLEFDFQSARASFAFEYARAFGVATPCGQRLVHLGCLIASAEVVAGGQDEKRAECAGRLDEDELAGARAVAARIRWQQIREPAEFLDVADLAISALHVPDAEELALSALEATLLFSCDTVPAVQVAAARIQRSDDAQTRHDARRARLIAMTPERCASQRK